MAVSFGKRTIPFGAVIAAVGSLASTLVERKTSVGFVGKVCGGSFARLAVKARV